MPRPKITTPPHEGATRWKREPSRDKGPCTDPSHRHCVECGCRIIRLNGERRRDYCVRCIADGKAGDTFRVDDFTGGLASWPWAT